MGLEETRRAIEEARRQPVAAFAARVKPDGRVLCGAPRGCPGELPRWRAEVFELEAWHLAGGVWELGRRARQRRNRLKRSFGPSAARSAASSEALEAQFQELERRVSHARELGESAERLEREYEAFMERLDELGLPLSKLPIDEHGGRRRLSLPAYFRCPWCLKINEVILRAPYLAK